MGFAGESQAAIIELLHRKYEQILPIETAWGIRFEEGDMRPRIEHFHDAVRALTSGEADMYAKHSRLSVEHLAYDLSMLRQIQNKPVGSINRVTEKSTSSALVKQGEAGASPPRMPPQAVRSELSSFYRDYTVFFAALFAEVADRNYQSRSDTIDNTVADVGLVENIVNQLIAGSMTATQANQELLHVEHDDLRERLQALLSRKKLSAREKQEALALLGKIETGLSKEKKALDTAHLNYATGQLAVYEEGKAIIQRLGASGLNLAGKFVENALRGATAPSRGQGR